jgi:YD repeat-containing protein
MGNGTVQTFALNDRLQMTNQTLTKGANVIQKYDYGYGQIDASGNLDITKNNGQLARVESHIGAAKQWTQKFSYDSIGRLSEANEFRGDTNALSYKQKFGYDRFGNLYRKNAANPTPGQQSPIGYTPIEDADISKSTNRFTTGTTYDDAGNVTTDTKFRNSNFSYDANGRMFKTSRTDTTNQASSVYDAAGMRVATKHNDNKKYPVMLLW